MPSRSLSIKRLDRLYDEALRSQADESALVNRLLIDLESEFNRYSQLCETSIEHDQAATVEAEFDEYSIKYDAARRHLYNLQSTCPPAQVNPEPTSSKQQSLEDLIERQQQILEALAVARPSTSQATLPKLEIPTFSGDTSDWTHFRDLFLSSVDSNASLSAVEKFHYLRSLVKGNAASVIANVPINSDNYAIAWNNLMETFDNDYAVVESIVTRFLSSESVYENHSNLRKIYNIFRETFEMLENQGSYANSRDPFAVILMLKKLDSRTNLAWATHSKSEKEPSIQYFLDFLKDRCVIFDRTRGSSTRSETHPTPSTAFNSKFRSRKPLSTNALTTYSCLYCQKSHSIYKCDSFRNLSSDSRRKYIAEQSRCSNCFSKDHPVSTCPSMKNCFICKRKHNTLLHRQTESSPLLVVPKTSSEKPVTNSPTSLNDPPSFVQTHFGCTRSSLLPTALVKVRGDDGAYLYARILLDSGSQATLISESFVKKLNLKREQVRVPISGIGKKTVIHSKGKVALQLTSRFCDSNTFFTNAYIVPQLTGELPQTHIHFSCINEMHSHFELADPSFNIPAEIDLIISASLFFEILDRKTFVNHKEGIHVQESKFGYIVCNRSDTDQILSSNNCLIDEPDHHYDELLQRFWTMEEPLVVKCPQTVEEMECENNFKSTVRRLLDGRFSVRLPLKRNPNCLGSSFSFASKRLIALENKLRSSTELREKYVNFMTEYETLGHMVKTTFTEYNLPFPHYIIPHHGVWQQGPTGMKLRVVFDASAKSSTGLSLNDILHIGPRLQNDLTAVINGFRSYRHVMIADIEKMYRQIQVDDADQNLQMVLWRPSSSEPISIFKLTTVTYGESCSPFLALRVIQELISQEETNYPRAVEVLNRNRYVDDILFGDNDPVELMSIRDELIALLSLGRLKLKKWASNNPSLLADVDSADLASPHVFTDKEGPQMKALGIVWKSIEDTFSYNFPSTELLTWTKRSLLSDTARLYDPLGWISPVILSFKLIFQATWVRQLEWDTTLPEDILRSWQSLRRDLETLKELAIPRFLGSGQVELHGFSDASKTAYAAVVYARVTKPDGSISVTLIMSKTKLAPIKPTSIPRLELCGAQILAKLINQVRKSFPESRITLWTDSTVVLAWIKSLPKTWNPFVCNRIANIQELCPSVPWFHVKSAQNPADIASRGASPSQLLRNSLWWSGPEFLKSATYVTPSDQFSTNEELRSPTVNSVVVSNEFWSDFILRFSKFMRLVRTLSLLLRARDRFKRNSISKNPIRATELLQALTFIIKMVQRIHFPDEIDRLSSNRELPKSSNIRSLCPFIDQHGIVRLNHRVKTPDKFFALKPILLPRSHFCDLLVQKVHVDTLHGGNKLVIGEIVAQFHILNLSQTVKRIIRACIQCRRYKADTFEPQMAPLPENRLVPKKPFFTTGIDFAGPVNLRPYRGRGRLIIKGYIAVLICFTSRAVHLELVMDLSTNALILSLQRFIARRGQCRYLVSDNGRNFVGCRRAMNEFKHSLETNLTSQDVQDFLANQFIEWKLNPIYSPHFGGLWESAVRSVKHHIKRTFNDTTLTIEEMSTALCRIESVLNSRPIAPVSISENLVPLTPAHLLTGEPSSAFPDLSLHPDLSTSIRSRQTFLTHLVENFWRRWRIDYVSTLLRRPKWNRKTDNPKIGDLVFVKRSSDPPSLWRLGEVTHVFSGPDGTIRVAEVRTAFGKSRESTRNLIPLDVDTSVSTGGEMSE